jgi:hypothetical protein
MICAGAGTLCDCLLARRSGAGAMMKIDEKIKELCEVRGWRKFSKVCSRYAVCDSVRTVPTVVDRNAAG